MQIVHEVTYMGVSEGQICVKVQEVDEVVTGMAIVDQLVVNRSGH